MSVFKKIAPRKGQESVWDYPRPPICELFPGHIRIIFAGKVIVDTAKAFRVLETSHPPVYYLPPADIDFSVLAKSSHQTYCEFKGMASYYDLEHDENSIRNAAWYYTDPHKSFAAMKDHVSFYAHKVDSCYVNDEKVQAQEGDFYGGWITSDIVGPFKGGAGTWGW